jgi:hypothetical protein
MRNKMKQIKNIQIALILVLTLFCVSAIYAGENYIFEIDTTDFLTWDVVDNSSSMEGFTVEQEIKDTYSIITFVIPLNYKPDNFTIILTSNKTKEVIKEIHSGGGSSRTIYRNNTIEKNNTVYVDKEIIVTKEVPVPVNVTVTPTSNENSDYNHWIYLLGGAFICFVIWCVFILTRKKKDDNNSQQGELPQNGVCDSLHLVRRTSKRQVNNAVDNIQFAESSSSVFPADENLKDGDGK